MKRLIRLSLYAAIASAVMVGSWNGLAQQRGGGQGGFNMEEMRQRMADRMKEILKVNDAEWAVLQPRIEKVQQLQRSARGGRGGMMMMMGGRRGGGDQGGRQGGRQGRGFGGEPDPTSEALQAALESDSTSTAEIKEKLAAYRKARKSRETELEKAQTALVEVLTPRQEAVCAMMGLVR